MDEKRGPDVKGYELRERIGAGGFGVVYRAYQSTVGREVAVKVILPGYTNHPDFIRRFETEAQLVARLEHLHIVPLYDYWRESQGAFLVMRLMRGGNLRDALQNGPYDLESAALLLDQIGSALSVAHRHNVIHRDIKPSNILLDEDGNAYLTDFGIAKDLECAESDIGDRDAFIGSPDALIGPSDALIGSPDYLSPEQARSEAVTPQSDVYSLGVVLYEMLTGEHPFPGLSSVEQLFKHINDPIPQMTSLDADVSEAMNQVVQKATAKDPRQRYLDVLEMITAFQEAAELSISQAVESPVELLTPREQEVLTYIIKGKLNREIAKLLTVELGTVKWYITQIYRKLNVRSRVQAIVRARELNLIVDGYARPGAYATSISRLPEPENPYKGLRPFQVADEQDFFGRVKLTVKLLRRLGEKVNYTRFLAVVGPSGSGKSSLVKAGLIPALWRGELPGSERWYIVEMMPGAHPLDELEIALVRITTGQSGNLREQLERDERGLIRAIQLILPDDRSELLLVIDQFEELFTLVTDEKDRVQFLDILYAAVSDPRSRIRVVITLRADFYDRPLRYPGFGELVRSRMETVLPLSVVELEQAIAGPAGRVGIGFEKGLIARIIDDVHYQPGMLPLLQYSLTELFEARQDRNLTMEGYKSIGGAVGAVAKRAEEVYTELDEFGRETIRQMFLRLVTLGDGSSQGTILPDTRRRVRRSELLAVAGDAELMDEIIDTYAAYRLLSLDHDPATRSPIVEVAHEAILREWARLRKWLNVARGDIRLQRQLATAAKEWRQSAQDPSFLLWGSRLEQFDAWAGETELALTPEERDYLAASLAEREREAAEEDARQARETTLEKRSQRVLQGLVAVFAIATLVVLVLFNFTRKAQVKAQNEANARATAQSEAIQEREFAEGQTRLAHSRELAAAALNQLSVDPERSVLLALQALSETYTLEAENALHQALPQLHLLRSLTGHTQNVESVAISPDGKRLASASIDGVVKIWDADKGQELLSFTAHNGNIFGLTYSPDGTLLATASDDHTAKVWDAATGQQMLAIDSGAPLSYVAFSPDGKRLATAGADAKAKVWLTKTGKLMLTLAGHEPADRIGSIHPGGVIGVAFSPDATRLVTGGADGTARIWDAQSGQELVTINGHVNEVYIALSPDGMRLLTAGFDGLIKVWNVPPGASMSEPELIINHEQAARAAAFSPDGTRIAVASQDGIARVWDAASGKNLLTLVGHAGLVDDVTFSLDGAYLLTGGEDRTVKMWDLAPSKEWLTVAGGLATYSPDGQFLAVEREGSVVILYSGSGETRSTIPTDHTHRIVHLIYSPDGKRLATASWDGTAKVFDVVSGREEYTLSGHTDRVWEVEFIPDGKFLVTSSEDQTARVWSAANGEELFALRGHTGAIQGLAISPDGNKIATASWGDKSVKLWDAHTGQELSTMDTENALSDVSFSPDGEYIAVGASDGSAIVWDISTADWRKIFTLTGHTSFIPRLAFSPDGGYLATASFDGTVKVWDLSSGQDWLTVSAQNYPVTNVTFSPDGTLLATGGFEGLVRIFVLDLDELVALARSRLTRVLTLEECQRFLHMEHCPTTNP